MRCGIVIDDWKLQTFRDGLEEEGFAYTHNPGPTPGCISIFVDVEPEDVPRLSETVHRLQQQARQLKN